jgi:hypothetical protein
MCQGWSKIENWQGLLVYKDGVNSDSYVRLNLKSLADNFKLFPDGSLLVRFALTVTIVGASWT